MVHKAFLCPEDTLFDQSIVKCNWWFYVDCAASPSIYDSNIPISKSYQLMKSLTYFSNFKKQAGVASEVNKNGRNDNWSSVNSDNDGSTGKQESSFIIETRPNSSRKLHKVKEDISESVMHQQNQTNNKEQNIVWEKQQINMNKIEKE